MAEQTDRPGEVELVPREAPAARPQPDPVESRPYLEIRPAETPVDPGAAAHAMGTIDALLRDTARGGLIRKLRGTTLAPVVEWLLVSDGRPDPAIRYLVGSNVSDLTEDLEGILRTAFPNGYELRPTRWHPAYAREFLPLTDGPQPAPYVAAVEYRGRARRKRDWQTPLTPFEAFTGPARGADRPARANARRVPLATLVETLADAELPTVFQVVADPYGDWTSRADAYVTDLDEGVVSFGDRVWEFISPRDREARNRYRPPPADRERIEGIVARDPRHTLRVSARAAVLARDRPERADAVARRLANALSPLSGRHHELVGQVRTDDGHDPGSGPGTAVLEDLLGRAVYHATYHRLGDTLRRRPHESRGLVVAREELPGFCVLDGAGLTPRGQRAVAARPAERTGLPLPPPEQLARYRPPGMALGMPLTHDRQPYGNPIYLPPADQDRHVIVIGPTGSGKSVLTETAMLTNVAATGGPAILLDYKGGGTAEEYLQAHYETYGTLEDVTYFDLTRTLPALSVLDIGPLLEAGVPREEARSRLAGHYEEILEGLMGGERYWQAVEAPKAIRNHLRALFDPVHGADAVAHRELFDALRRTIRDGAPPPVADDRLADFFASLLDRDRDVFNRVLGGALNRVETIATDGRLAPVFDHVPGADDDPHFDFADVIDEDRVVIFDFGGMEAGAKRALTLALLSGLWRALQARAHDPDAAGETPLVNCYLEEAGAIADSAILDVLLSQGRSFGLSMFLGVQFLGQLDSPDPSSRTHEEAINETATVIAGQVAVRDDLVDALASDELPPGELNRRLSRLPRGEWLVRPGTAFGAESLRPFLVESLPAPPGHPQGAEPLEPGARKAFEAAFERVREETRRAHGLDGAEISRVDASELDDAGDEPTGDAAPPVDRCYAHTKRMPEPVVYRAATDALHCRECGNRYDPDVEGMIRAVECCSSLDDIDRDDVPPGDLNLKLSTDERAERPLSGAQLRLLQAVYNAAQRRYHPLEYDLTRDSMLRLCEYVGIEADEVQALIDAGLLRKDTDHPFRLYSVTPDGREAIGEAYREGVDYGHGRGDLEESAQHVLGVDLVARFVEAEYEADPDCEVATVNRYHELGGNRRLDVAGLDEDGNVVVAVEVERVNHDVRRAVPEDFDKLASCEPDEAIWVAMSHSEAHEILEALNDPLAGEPRVTKTYAKGTPAQMFSIAEPGFTAMYTVDQLRDRLGLE